MLLALYPSKKDLKAAVGSRLKYEETSCFGLEYKSNCSVAVANRPHLTGMGREFFAEVTIENDVIVKVS